MIELRDYQRDLVDRIHGEWERGARNTLLVLPTGGGKTVVISEIIRTTPVPSRIIAHRQELVSQISLALARNSIRHSLIAPTSVIRSICKLHMSEIGAMYYHPHATCAVAGVDTLVRRGDPAAASVGLWVTDEAHHLAPRDNKWGEAVGLYPNARGLGVTATPCRADGRGLGCHADGVMDSMVIGPDMRELIDRGYLTDYKIYVPPSDVDLSGVSVSESTGDYSKPKLSKAMRKSHIVGDVVEHYLRIAPGRLGVTFTTDVEMAHTIADAYNAAGVPAVALSGKTPDSERWEALRRFRRREIMQLVNCALFDEGFDLPAIEVVSMARPTASYGLYVQTFGRGLRIMEGKDQAIIIDHVGNVIKHGLPDARTSWTLDAREKRGRNTPNDTIPLRSCMQCFGVYERVLAACPYCGHVHQPSGRSTPEQVDGSLVELDPAVLAAMRGEVERIDQPAKIPYGATRVVTASIKKRHAERQEAQQELRATIAQWGGWQQHHGRSIDEAQRLFFFRFGVDVLSAQALGTREARELNDRVRADYVG